MDKVKMANPNLISIKTEYYLNGKRLKKVKCLDVHAADGKVPVCKFTLIGGAPNIDMLSDVQFSFTPETVQQACVVLRNELLKYGQFRQAFRDSIRSSLEDDFVVGLPFGDTIEEIAENVLKRITGEDCV